jgi:ABC-type multidrug transport system fused ATPase/permease subunit
MKTLKLLLGYAKNYFGPLGVTVVSMVLLMGVQLLAPWVIKMMIAAVKDQAGGQAPMDQIARLALLALAVYVVRAGL